MNFSTLKKILLRLYHSYIKKYFRKLIISLLLSIGVACCTAAIAWLLDPAIEKMFIEQDKSMMLLIPIAIVFAFAGKGLSLYLARVVLIKVGNNIVTTIQKQLASTILKSDIHTLESKHSGQYISHIMFDVGQVNTLVSNGVLNLMKDSLTLIVLVGLMFYQNWKLAFFALLMMPLAAFVAKSLGKRIGKATKESLHLNASLTTYLSEMLKGSRMIKIFQKEKFESERANKILEDYFAAKNRILQSANLKQTDLQGTPIDLDTYMLRDDMDLWTDNPDPYPWIQFGQEFAASVFGMNKGYKAGEKLLTSKNLQKLKRRLLTF